MAKMTLFRDEKGNVSSARVYLAAWLTVVAVAAWTGPQEAFWGVATPVALGLISWAAGARIAEYLAPQVGAFGSAIAEALKPKDKKKEEESE